MKLVRTILFSALLAFLLFFVGYQIYSAAYSPYQTETVARVSYEDKIEVDGIFMRSEKVITANHSGFIVHYLYSNGAKVGAGGTVAELYASESDVLNYEKIKELENRLLLLQQSQDQSSALVTNADQITTQINSKLRELSSAIYSKDFAAVEKCKDELQILLNRRNIITEKEENFNEYISQIKNEISSLKKKLKVSYTKIKADTNGNFVIKADGYEQSAKYDDISSMSAADIEKFINESTPDSVSDKTIGKLVTDFDWYYTMILPIDDEEYNERIKVGTTLKMRFNDVSDEIVNVTVSKVVLDEKNAKMAVFVKSNHLTPELCSARKEKADIIFSTAKGFKIKKSAVKFNEDGEKGAFVVIGKQMFFRKINVLYEETDYVVCEITSGNGGLKQFDDVVVKGTDLYDGKSL